MKIAYDAKRFFHNTSGLGNYSRDVIRILATFYPENQYFLLNKNRLNVAISRAQCMAIVVYSPALLDSHIGCVEQLEQMNLLGWLVANKPG